MNRIALNTLTLYSDLAQKLIEPPIERPGSITTRGAYLYASRRQGPTTRQTFLGRADDATVRERADAIKREAALAKVRRNTVTMLKSGGLRGPEPHVGRVLEALSYAGLFDRGLVLVGTVAFQIFPAIVGHRLTEASLATQDADFVAATTSLTMAVDPEIETADQPFLQLLRTVDPSFRGAPQLSKSAPSSRFVTEQGFDVELLTPARNRDDTNPVPLPALGAGAIPLHFLEYLIEDAIPAIALFGSGVRVKIPAPGRYAVHKLIVADRRDEVSRKGPKDLEQARLLFEAIEATEPATLDDALDDALGRGPAWRRSIEKGLAVIAPHRL